MVGEQVDPVAHRDPEVGGDGGVGVSAAHGEQPPEHGFDTTGTARAGLDSRCRGDSHATSRDGRAHGLPSMMSRRRRLRGPPSGVVVAYLVLIQDQYDAIGIADKIAEVVLGVLLVVEGRRDRTTPAGADADRCGR